jgi:hypothetical protein
MKLKSRDMNFDSFKDAPWFNPNLNIIIGGLGNIGSWTALLLSRMGYTLYLYDYDTVEMRNVGSQLYGPKDIGKLKTVALKERLVDVSGNGKISMFGKYEVSSMTSNIVISCFDNMNARKLMFDKWVAFQMSMTDRNPKDINIFLDGRSLAEVGIVYSVRSVSDVEKYRAELFTDAEVEHQECSFKSTSHNGAMIASLIVTQLTNHIFNKYAGAKVRSTPFKIDYQLPLLMFSETL